MQGDNYAALRDATLGASNIQAPASPLGAPNAPELAKLYQSSFQLPQSNAATQVQGANTQTTVSNQKAAAAAQVAALKQKAQDLMDEQDASKYTLKRKQDGGFDFFDPKGNQVDIATFSSKTGKKATDILKDSDNPIDQQYVSDYNNLQDLLGAVINKDTSKLDSYKQQFEAEGLPDITKMKPQDVINQFQQHYQRYYVPRSVNPNAWGTTPSSNLFAPNQQVNSNAYPSLGGGLPG